MNNIIGKTIESIDDEACNFKTINFTDGSKLEIETECYNSAVNLYGATLRYKENCILQTEEKYESTNTL